MEKRQERRHFSAQHEGSGQLGRGAKQEVMSPELGQRPGWPEVDAHPILGALHFDDLGGQRQACGLLRAPVDLTEPAPAGTVTQ